MRRTLVAPLVLAAVLVAGCGSGTGEPSSSSAARTPAPTAAPSGSPAPGSAEPSESIEPGSPEPADTPEPTAPESSSPEESTDVPTEAPVDSPSPEASASASPAVGAECQPQGSNPEFWSGVSHSVSWSIYCGVLPSGWFLQSGSYRAAGGGKLLVTYKGPNGATLALSEGSFCTDGSGCVPSGSDAGDARFGSLDGTLVALDGGGFAIVVARGEQPSWLLVSQGLDQATTVSLGATLAQVSG